MYEVFLVMNTQDVPAYLIWVPMYFLFTVTYGLPLVIARLFANSEFKTMWGYDLARIKIHIAQWQQVAEKLEKVEQLKREALEKEKKAEANVIEVIRAKKGGSV